MKSILVILSLLVFGALAVADIIPSDRRITWQGNVGVPGGIPPRTIIAATVNAAVYGDGTTDATQAIKNAIAACTPGAGQVAYIPAGTYLISSKIVDANFRSGFSLRGDGPGRTILKATMSDPVIALGYSGALGTSVPIANGGATASSDTVTLNGSTTDFHEGHLCLIAQDHLSYVVGVEAQPQTITFHVVSKTANTVKLSHPLPCNFTESAVLIPYVAFPVSSIGVEDLTIDCNYVGQTGIQMVQTWGSWIKNVEVKRSTRRQMFLTIFTQGEIRHCFTHDTLTKSGPNHEGLDFYDHSCWNLIEDNIADNGGFPEIMLGDSHGGCSANVIAHNFCKNAVTGTPIAGANIGFNHGAHNAFNLAEGNIVENGISSDGYFGSSSHNTIFRNWAWAKPYTAFDGGQYIGSINGTTMTITSVVRPLAENQDDHDGNLQAGIGITGANVAPGTKVVSLGPNTNGGVGTYTLNMSSNVGSTTLSTVWTTTSGLRAIELNRMSNYYNVVGNVLGDSSFSRTPGAGGGNYDSETVDYPELQLIYELGFPNVGNKGYSGVLQPTYSPPDYYPPHYPTTCYIADENCHRELDLYVKNTLLRHGNYDYFNLQQRWDPSIPDQNLPNSYYLATKPSYFGGLTWPAINPADTTTAAVTNVPAGYRYIHGIDPPTAVSRKTHGGAGAFDVNLPLNGSPGIECRSGGANNDYQIVVTFQTPFNGTDAVTAMLTGGVGSVSGSPTIGGMGNNEVTVNLTGVTDIQTITLTLAGSSNGNSFSGVAIPMGVLVGDANASRTVNSSDVSQVKVAMNPVVAANFRTDLIANGQIDSADVSLVKFKSGNSLP